jgi:hypothetical protein
MNREVDVRHVLATIRVPTLVLHRCGDVAVSIDQGRYLADHIPGAKFGELPGSDHIPMFGDADRLVDEVEEFLTGSRSAAEPDRVLATVMFTDIVDSSSARPKSATGRGARYSIATTRWCASSSHGFVAVK